MSIALDFKIEEIDWAKSGGVVPCVIQDVETKQVLMLGYMSKESLAATIACGDVTFFSRSRQKLWRKGETSGHILEAKSVSLDCDKDTLLVSAVPKGPTCHLGTASCFDRGKLSSMPIGRPADPSAIGISFLAELWRTIELRAADKQSESSYTQKLLASGVRRQAQKVGEEGVEVALAAVAQDDQALLGEAADLIYHLMVLLKGRGLSFSAVCEVLKLRHQG
jgi:phosphoribosyl-AMP cyclohydrolase / phosphoribosyl-ATP pyrophosphohydrolase